MSLSDLQKRRITKDRVFVVGSLTPELCNNSTEECALCGGARPVWRVTWKRAKNEIFSKTAAPLPCLVCHTCLPVAQQKAHLSDEQVAEVQVFLNRRRYEKLYAKLIDLATLGNSEAYYFVTRINCGEHLDPEDLRRAWTLAREKNIWGLVV